jgi:uncharacterized protein (TIGR04255 family)
MSIGSSNALPRPPLIFVLAQVKILPVLKMNAFVPDIQETLRANGYPHFREVNSQNIFLGDNPSVKTITWWEFKSTDNRQSVVLTNDSITVQTTKYQTFDSLIADIGCVIDPLATYAKPQGVRQQGLRYVDLLADIDGLNTDDLLAPGFRGIKPGMIAPDVKQSASTFVVQAKTPHGILSIRSVQVLGSEQQVLPPDLSGMPLTLADWVGQAQNRRVLDFDHATPDGIAPPFSAEEIASKFRDLHQYTDLAFRAVTTEAAREAWGRSRDHKELNS